MKTLGRILSSFRFPLSVLSCPCRSIHELAIVLATSVLLVAVPLSACGGAAPSPQLRTQALVTVDASSVLLQIPSTAFGINTAVWDGHLLDANLNSLLSAARVNVLRYPGGSTSDAYH